MTVAIALWGIALGVSIGHKAVVAEFVYMFRRAVYVRWLVDLVLRREAQWR